MNATLFSTRHVTPAADSDLPTSACAGAERALVLGGGGSSGNAWVIGVVAGLLDGGLDVTDADLVVGTSSGSTAAAMLTGTDPRELFAGVLATATPPRTAASPGGGGTVRAVNDHMERTGRIIAAASDPADMRRRLGAAALELDAASDGSGQTRWRATVAARLPREDWPRQRVLITAVDAATGEPVAFDRSSGVDLADAVAASCSSGPPYRIGDGRYIDGGYRRSADNADLAAGYERVLVLSPLGGRSRAPLDWGMHLAAQVDELRAGGSRVETVQPDSRALEAFGEGLMDVTRRAPTARAGFDQGSALAERLTAFWQ
jgi:NTE family protein